MPVLRMSFVVRGMIIASALLLAAPLPANAQEPYFPELVFFPHNKDLNAIVVDHLTLQLKAMKEPSLWKLARKDRTATVYRFLWLATHERPICVRMSRSGETFSLHVTRHDGSPGLTVGRLILDKDVRISREQGDGIIKLLQKTPFWTAPVSVKESRGIADGDLIVIEGVKEGKYHIVDRAGSTTGESYKSFCRSLLELAGPEVLKVWDSFRQEERKEPGYRPEPPETEDRGDPEPDTNEL
jgi:hypothetical protein